MPPWSNFLSPRGRRPSGDASGTSLGASPGGTQDEDQVLRTILRSADQAAEADSPSPAAVFAAPPANLASLGREELCERLRVQAEAFAKLCELVKPLKVENVRLARSLRFGCNMLQEVVQALRQFFRDNSRREWFRAQQDDLELVCFFQQLITWYRRVTTETNNTVAFYRRVWDYERGADAADEVIAACAEEAGEASSSSAGTRQMSSARLYDACHARAENLLLQEENIRLREENKRLREVLKKHQLDTSGVSLPPTRPRSEAAPGCRSARTLRQLAAADARWTLLLEDPGGLFSGEDVIDDTYEQYLGDVLELMRRHRCDFRKAVALSAEQGGRGGPFAVGEALGKQKEPG